MLKSKKIALCKFALLLVFVLSVTPSKVCASTDELLKALKRFEQGVVEKRLSNGLRVLFYRRGVAPVFAGVVTVGVGGVDEVPGQTGISHLLEHMAFKGTESIGTTDSVREKELLEELEVIAIDSNGARNMSPEQQSEWSRIQSDLKEIWEPTRLDREYKKRGEVGLNATTSKELTTYFVNFPTSAFEFWAWIESERILRPIMRQFYKERDVVMEERRMRYEDSPDGKLYERLLGVAYLEHPYRNPVIGYESDIKGLLASETLAFQKSYYVPGNIVVSVVGDIDPEEGAKVLERFFGRIPKGPMPHRPTIIESPQEGERVFQLETDAAAKIMIAYKKPNYPHPDDAAITVFEEIAAGGRVSYMVKQLVQRERVLAGLSVFEAPGNSYPNLVVFAATPKSVYSNDFALERFDSTLASLLKSPPTADQLEIAKRSIAMSFLNRMDANMSLAQDLSRSELQFGDWRSVTQWFKEVIAVTAEDVHRVANKYFQSSSRTVGRLESIKGDN